jgi:hypothetical protein
MTTRRAIARVPFGSRLLLVAFCILACPAPGYSQRDPAIGRWKLNVAKSIYRPGVIPPKSALVTIEPAGQGIKVTVRTIGGDGQTTELHYTAYVDGNDYPVKGSRDYDSVSLQHAGLVVEGTRKKDGKVVQTYQRVLSSDGKTMTVATTWMTAQGQQLNTVAVYERQ